MILRARQHIQVVVNKLSESILEIERKEESLREASKVIKDWRRKYKQSDKENQKLLCLTAELNADKARL